MNGAAGKKLVKLRRSYCSGNKQQTVAAAAAASAYIVIAGGLAWRKAQGNNPIPFATLKYVLKTVL